MLQPFDPGAGWAYQAGISRTGRSGAAYRLNETDRQVPLPDLAGSCDQIRVSKRVVIDVPLQQLNSP